jgi:hypothetical protein
MTSSARKVAQRKHAHNSFENRLSSKGEPLFLGIESIRTPLKGAIGHRPWVLEMRVSEDCHEEVPLFFQSGNGSGVYPLAPPREKKHRPSPILILSQRPLQSNSRRAAKVLLRTRLRPEPIAGLSSWAFGNGVARSPKLLEMQETPVWYFRGSNSPRQKGSWARFGRERHSTLRSQLAALPNLLKYSMSDRSFQ